MPGLAHRLRDEFEPKRLEPQKHLCIHQGSGMDTEQPHGSALLSIHPPEPEPVLLPQPPGFAPTAEHVHY